MVIYIYWIFIRYVNGYVYIACALLVSSNVGRKMLYDPSLLKRGYLGNPIHKWQFNGKIIFKWWFSIAMFDYRKVTMEF